MVRTAQNHLRQRREGRFFGLRVNCEQVPSLPAWAVRRILDDPRKIPYLLVWRRPWDGAIKEVVRVMRVAPPACFPEVEAIEVKRSGRSVTDLHVFRRLLPRHGGHDIFLECPGCRELRRALYGWEAGGATTRSAYLSQWQCRECAGLRYASEGGALLIRSRGIIGRMFGVGRSGRPKPCYPQLFSSPSNPMSRGDAAAAGVCVPREGYP